MKRPRSGSGSGGSLSAASPPPRRPAWPRRRGRACPAGRACRRSALQLDGAALRQRPRRRSVPVAVDRLCVRPASSTAPASPAGRARPPLADGAGDHARVEQGAGQLRGRPRAPGEFGACWRIDLPRAGASANRIDLRTGGCSTGIPYRASTSSMMCRECRVRSSYMVAMMPRTARSLLAKARTSSMVSSSWPTPRWESASHWSGMSTRVGRGQPVDGQDAEGRGAVDEDRGRSGRAPARGPARARAPGRCGSGDGPRTRPGRWWPGSRSRPGDAGDRAGPPRPRCPGGRRRRGASGPGRRGRSPARRSGRPGGRDRPPGCGARTPPRPRPASGRSSSWPRRPSGWPRPARRSPAESTPGRAEGRTDGGQKPAMPTIGPVQRDPAHRPEERGRRS